jgi:PAS domain S-box-containing protein
VTEKENTIISLDAGEKLLFGLLENVHLIAVYLDLDGKVTFFNPYLLSLSGYTSIEMTGMDWFGQMIPEAHTETKEAFLAGIKSGNITWHSENPIITKSGELRDIYWSNTILHDSSGTVAGTAGIGEDITDRKRAEPENQKLIAELEQKIIELTTQLEAVNKAMETFTYSVSHDLKAPLRGIDGYSKLLLELHKNNLNEEGQSFLSSIRNSTMKMNQLIDDLLEYSRFGRSTLRKEIIRIKDLMTSVLSVYSEDLIAGKFTVNMDIADIEIVVDYKSFTIALRNLLENAIKFTKVRTNPLINILLENKDTSWILSINDNGIGFDMKFHQKIFEIFQRLHRAEDYPGTGIGLAMVRKAMLIMNGSVWAESSPGNGSTFFLEIPKPI